MFCPNQTSRLATFCVHAYPSSRTRPSCKGSCRTLSRGQVVYKVLRPVFLTQKSVVGKITSISRLCPNYRIPRCNACCQGTGPPQTGRRLRSRRPEGAVAGEHRLPILTIVILSCMRKPSLPRENLLSFQHEARRPVLPFLSLLVDPQHTLTKEIF